MEMPTAWSPKFGGLKVGVEKYSDDNRARAIEFIHDARVVLGNLPEGYLKGSRYQSDEHVLWCLESGADEVQFFTDPLLMAIGALLGAAASDHWYTYEKDWGNDYEGEDEECEVIDE